MGAEIVCQVIGRPDQVTFIWSEGPAAFEPYQLTGQGLVNFRALGQQARQALSDLVKDYLQGTEEDVRRSSFALAKVGAKLCQQVFRPAAGPSQYVAKRVRSWLADMHKHGQIDSLEIVDDGLGPLPWNVVYEGEPDEKAFLAGGPLDCYRPFWGLRYNLAVGRRVEPMRRLPWLEAPKLLVVVDPAIRDGLPDDQRARLAQFAKDNDVHVVESKGQLAAAMEDHRPDVMYWLCHATPSALVLGDEEISPADLLDLFRGQLDEDDRLGGLAFLNACQTAEGSEVGSFIDALYEVGLSGVIATEHQTVDTFANPFGLDFLDAFLNRGEPVGGLLQKLRSKGVPLGLLYSTYCPPAIRVLRADADTAERALYAAERRSGVALGGPARPRPAPREVAESPPIPLPDEPYRLFAPFERKDRALFVGRDDDVRRFALILDDPKARLVVLHGESGVGKSSFLRAGAIPYLEEECVGYQFLTVCSEKGGEPACRFIRATNDLVGQVAQVLAEFCAQPYSYATLGKSSGTARVDLAAIASELIGGDVRPETMNAALRADPGLFGRLLKAISRRLPHAPVLVIDQAEEVFTLARTPADVENARLAVAMLRRAIAESGNFKIVVSLRTEYYGRFIDRLRSGVRDVGGVREYLLTDFGVRSLVEAIRRPTSATPIEGVAEVPGQKYGFRFEDGVPERIAREVIAQNVQGHDGVLPLVQVICSQLYEMARKHPDPTIRPEDLDAIGGVRGGMRRHVELLAGRLLREHPGDLVAFKRLLARLYLRQSDGALTTALIPLDDLAARWSGRSPFDAMVRSAAELRLLKVNALSLGDEEERLYVSLGHDALAKVAAAWDDDLRRGGRLRKLAAVTLASLTLAASMTLLAAYALVQRQQARSQRDRAIAYLDRTMETLDQLLIGVAQVDLVDVPQMVPIRRRLLGRARAGYERLLGDYGEGGKFGPQSADPKVRRGLARAYTNLGDIERLMGDFRPARDDLSRGLAFLDAASGEDRADDGWRRDLSRAYHGLGETYRGLDDLEQARDYLRRAIRLREGLTGDGDDLDALAESHEALAALLFQFTGQSEETRAEFREAIRLVQEREARRLGRAGASSGPEPTEATLAVASKKEGGLVRLARYLDNLGRLEQALGRKDEADRRYRQALEILEGPRLGAARDQPGARWQLARCWNNRGALLYSPDRPEGRSPAGKLLDDARGGLRRLVAEFPDVPQYRRELAVVCQNLGRLEADAGRAAWDDFLRAATRADVPKAKEAFGRAKAADARALADFLEVERMFREAPDEPGDAPTTAGRRPEDTETAWVRAKTAFEADLVRTAEGQASALPGLLDRLGRDLGDLEAILARYLGPKPGGPDVPRYREQLAGKYHAYSRFLTNFLELRWKPGLLPPSLPSRLDAEARRALARAVEHQEKGLDRGLWQTYRKELEVLGKRREPAPPAMAGRAAG